MGKCICIVESNHFTEVKWWENLTYVSPDVMHHEIHNVTDSVALPKIFTLNLIN